MFNKNTYLQYPQVLPSLHARASTSVLSLNGNEILLHHHGHHDVISGYYLASNPPNLEPDALFNGYHQEVGGTSGDPLALANSFAKKHTPKKDRHSKIHTAQGPRDRRVRLSIGIARKFFDLQEMLGFDKPSKTLDWLLTKSKEAIKELVQSKSAKSNVSNSPSECEEVLSADLPYIGSKGKAAMLNSYKCKGGKDTVDLAKESRAKARARARERTKEKMCIKQLNQARSKSYEWNPSVLFQSKSSQQYEVSGPSTNYEELNQESIMIKRKLKQNHPSMFGFQSENATENWDYYSNFSSQSNQLCAILDQHKFIN